MMTMGRLINSKGDTVVIGQGTGEFFLEFIPADTNIPITTKSFVHFDAAMEVVAEFLFEAE